jgi:acyl-CoA dehydrogenase
MILLNPKNLSREYPDERSKDIMQKTIEFFENRGKTKLKEMDHNRVWYSDFLEFIKKERIFSTLLTPSGYADKGDADTRWDTWRNATGTPGRSQFLALAPSG